MSHGPEQHGGYAYPKTVVMGDRAVSEGGMTMRDFFAAQVMEKMLNDVEIKKENGDIHASRVGSYRQMYEYAANHAYLYAEAMLTERKKVMA